MHLNQCIVSSSSSLLRATGTCRNSGRLAVLLLTVLVSTYAQPFQPSTFMCHGESKDHRVCLFSNLVVCNSTIYYLSDTPVTLPEVSGYRGTEPGPDLHIVAPAHLPCRIKTTNAPELEVVPRSTLIYRMHADNWFHTIIDIQPHLHQMLCKFFNFCSYVPEQLAAVKLIFYDNFVQHTGAFAETWGCYSSQPPVYLQSREASQKVMLLKAVLTGWTAAIFDGPQVAGVRHMAGHQGETWFQRIRTCTNTPVQSHVAQMPRPVFTFVHRSFFDSRKARAFLNVHDLVEELREKFPVVEFRIVRLRKMSFQQIVHTFFDSSVVFAVSGAAVSNVVWMRRGAVMVDVGFSNYHPRWIQSITHAIQPTLGVFHQMMTIGDPLATPARWERVARDPLFQNLSKEDILGLLQHHRCPAAPPDAAYACAALWTYFRSDVALPSDWVVEVVQESMNHLRRMGMYWTDPNAAATALPAGTATTTVIGNAAAATIPVATQQQQQQQARGLKEHINDRYAKQPMLLPGQMVDNE